MTDIRQIPRFSRLTISVILLFLTLFLIMPSPSSAAAIVTFDGHGYGHGVGMSMIGVYYMSKDDPTYNTEGGYRRILEYYYTGITWGAIDDNTVVQAQIPGGTDAPKVAITMKEYLYRESEEPNTWPREGLRATMVAMRTYAWQKWITMGYIPNWGQAWNPAIDPAGRPNIVAAVNDTAGQILTYGGQPIVTAYSSSSGGYTARFEDVWGNPYAPYCERKPSPWDGAGANANWQKMILPSAIETAYPSIGTFAGIQVTQRNGVGEWGGRVVRLKVIGSAGSVNDLGWNFASKLGLKSNYFTFNYDFSQSALFTSLSGSGFSAMTPNWSSAINGWSWGASKTLAGDFNGDGKDDVAVLYGYNGAQTRLWVFLNDGSGGFNSSPVLWWDSGPGQWDWGASKPVTGDFNNDGLADLAILYGYGTTRQSKAWVFINSGAGNSAPQQWWDSGPNKWDWAGSKVTSGDFSGDGRADLNIFYGYATTRQSRSWMMTTNSSGNGFISPQVWWDSGPNKWDWAGSKVVAGNFNGDTRADLAVFYGYSATRQSRAWVFPANGTGNAFISPQIWWDSGPNNWDWAGSKANAGEFNSDSMADLIIYYGYAGSRTIAWKLASTGSGFTLSSLWDSGPGNWDWSRSKFVTGTFDAEGRSDVGALYNYGTAQLTTDD